MAVNALRRYDADVVILDIEMPRMDGLTALPLLLEARPNVQIIVASTLTEKNAEISLQALERGAADYLTKPTSAHGLGSMEAFNHQLVEKVLALGYANRDRPRPAPTRSGPPRRVPASPEYRSSARPAEQKYRPSVRARPPKVRLLEPGGDDGKIVAALTQQPQEIVLRAAGTSIPEIIAIGSSTGGPQALFNVLRELAPGLNVPVMITQHMPPTFTTILAEHINKATKLPCKEAESGERLQRGTIYVAPGDYHMIVNADDNLPVIMLNQSEPVNYCRPAVDPMFASLVKIYGPKILAVILTGMGHDGLEGSQEVVEAGGTLVAQDETSSVVWGMPGAVATRGLCSAVLPLDQIGGHLRKFVLRSAA
jgi:two-component system chemotaxis response regulator CheB